MTNISGQDIDILSWPVTFLLSPVYDVSDAHGTYKMYLRSGRPKGFSTDV